MAAIAEQMRVRNDLFEVASVHWQTFWESTNANLLAKVKVALSDFDTLALPDEQQSDNRELMNALWFHCFGSVILPHDWDAYQTSKT